MTVCLIISRRWVLVSTAVILLFCASAATINDPVIETGPYELIYPENFGNRFFIPQNNLLTKQGVYLGRKLFYEKALSSDNSISCGNCHQQQLAFTDGRAFSEGVNGELADRSSMSLANLLWVQHFFWDGRVKGLEEQAVFPMTSAHEMNQTLEVSAKRLSQNKLYRLLFKQVYGNDTINPDRIVRAITQFERTLISANAPYDKYLRGEYHLTASEEHGMSLFMQPPDPKNNIRGANCARCHGTPKMFIELFHNNGLDSMPADIGREQLTGNPMDRGRFRVPTLRNIALTAPYMHDGRFKTLEEVIDHYSDHIVSSEALSPLLQNVSNSENGKTLALTLNEKEDIVGFLNLLTDTDFITDKRFADPNKK